MKEKVKAILSSALVLTLIGVIVTAALAGTNLFTKDAIAEAQAKANAEACKTVMDADSFTETELELDGETVTYYVAKSGDTLRGYVFKVTSKGKSAGLVVMTGISPDGVITGVTVTDNNETAGYVDKVIAGGMTDALKGRNASDADSVDTVSNATKTSKGIKAGVARAFELFEIVKEGA